MSSDLTQTNFNNDVDFEPETITYTIPAVIEIFFNRLVYNVIVERTVDDADFDTKLVLNEIYDKSEYERYSDDQTQYPGSVLQECSKVSWNYTYKTRAHVQFRVYYNRERFHYEPTLIKYVDDHEANYVATSLGTDSPEITAFEDNANLTTKISSVDHCYNTGDKISISGTDNYDGVYEIEKIDADHYVIPLAFQGDDAKGSSKLFFQFTVENGRSIDLPINQYDIQF